MIICLFWTRQNWKSPFLLTLNTCSLQTCGSEFPTITATNLTLRYVGFTWNGKWEKKNFIFHYFHFSCFDVLLVFIETFISFDNFNIGSVIDSFPVATSVSINGKTKNEICLKKKNLKTIKTLIPKLFKNDRNFGWIFNFFLSFS